MIIHYIHTIHYTTVFLVLCLRKLQTMQNKIASLRQNTGGVALRPLSR